MINKIKIKKYVYFTLSLIILICATSCGGSRSAWIKDTPLENSYHKIIMQKFDIDPSLEKDYPEATAACESTAVNELLRKSSISKIVKVKSSASRESGAIIIKTRVSTLKIVSSAARGSVMAVDLKLIDAASGQIVREKNISTANNAHTASQTSASSDRSLPYDLGKMIAEYIAEVVR
jgi:hypothetical protein